MNKNVHLHNTQGDILFPATKSHIVEYDSKGSGLVAATVKEAIDLVASNLNKQGTDLGKLDTKVTEIDNKVITLIDDSSLLKRLIHELEVRTDNVESNAEIITKAVIELSDKTDLNENNIISLATTVQDVIDEVQVHENNISTIGTYLVEHEKVKIESGLADW